MTAEKDEIAKRIGRNITNLLIENDMNQLELARILDVHKATVSAWCNGTRIPRMPVVDKMCEHFGVPRSRILGEATYRATAIRTKYPDLHIAIETLSPEQAEFVADTIRRLRAYGDKLK